MPPPTIQILVTECLPLVGLETHYAARYEPTIINNRTNRNRTEKSPYNTILVTNNKNFLTNANLVGISQYKKKIAGKTKKKTKELMSIFY